MYCFYLSMADEFNIDTYTEETFKATESVAESRDKAFTLKQSKATMHKTEKYLSTRSVGESLRESFHLIKCALEQYVAAGTDAVNDRMQLEHYCKAQLGLLENMNEKFWGEFARYKDKISYKFAARMFPTENESWKVGFTGQTHKNTRVDDEITDTKATDAEARKKASEHRNDILAKISDQYDAGRVGGRHFMDRGGSGGESDIFEPLEKSAYYSMASQSEIEHIFSMCAKGKFYSLMLRLWCLLVSSRGFVHHIIGSELITNLMFNPHLYKHETLVEGKVKVVVQNPFLDEKYKEIIDHYMFYGIYLLSKEEAVLGTKCEDDARHLLDIRAVSKLPQFVGNLESSPYVPVTLSNKYLYGGADASETVIRHISARPEDRGLYGLEAFKSRFAIFTNGMLEGLDFDHLYFTGSLISACLIRSPFEKGFGVGCDSWSVGDWTAMAGNLGRYFDEYYPSKDVINTTGMSNSDVAELETYLTDIDCIIDVNGDEEFDTASLRVYDCVKRNLLTKHTEAAVAKGLNIVKIETPQSYKYQINGKLVVRTFELFRIFDIRPSGCVARFHFSIVRGYYNGATVRVHPSLLCSANTGMCLDYKWMSDSKKPQTLVCKYYIRGFYVLLNDEEQKTIRKFVSDEKKWQMLNECDQFITNAMNPIFNPRVHGVGIWYDLREKYEDRLVASKPMKYIAPMNGFEKLVTEGAKVSTFGFDLGVRFPAGHIKPINMWHCMPYESDLNNSRKYGNF